MQDSKQGTLILGIENPLLDISVNAEQDLYKRFDLPLDATILAEEKHLPLFKELKEKYVPTYVPGGSTQNTLRAAQVLDLNESNLNSGCWIRNSITRVASLEALEMMRMASCWATSWTSTMWKRIIT